MMVLVKCRIKMADGKSSEVLRQRNTELTSRKSKKGITGDKRDVWLGNILTILWYNAAVVRVAT